MRYAWLLLSLLFAAETHGADPAAQVSLTPQWNAALPGDTRWQDQAGRAVLLQTLTRGHPTLLVLAYYHCPMLCPRLLHALADALRTAGFGKDTDLRVVVLSIDPRDTVAVAQAAHSRFVVRAGLSPDRVHFLTGPATSSERVAAAVGIRYAYDGEHGEYAHPAVYILADEQGRVARYLQAFSTGAADLRLALADVASGTPPDLWTQALLLCYAYDPDTGSYTLAIQTILRMAGLLTVASLVGLFLWQRKRSRP